MFGIAIFVHTYIYKYLHVYLHMIVDAIYIDGGHSGICGVIRSAAHL